MKKTARFRTFAALYVLLFLALSHIVSTGVGAACAHTWKSYSDADHPHAKYRMCSKCYAVEYTGGYATKSHGSGAWGSGTCPDCGSHSYSGRSCTSAGSCSCGATISAYGHSWSHAGYEAAHPHYNYDRCSRCNGTRRASGTNYMSSCATCNPPHTHNYSGRNCTYGGQCSCGQAGTPLGHSYTGSATYSDESHPHAQYKFCARTNCWYKNYLGTNATKNHGSGASGSGTCPDCGSCTSFTTPTYSQTHPHNGTKNCVDCGETHSAGTTTMSNCSVCNPHTHDFNSPIQYRAEHPHSGYRPCKIAGCASTQDTGTNATPSWSIDYSSHPHDGVQVCTVKANCTYTTQAPAPYDGLYPGCRTCYPNRSLKLRIMMAESYRDDWGSDALSRMANDTVSIRTPFASTWGISFSRSYDDIDGLPYDDCPSSSYGSYCTCEVTGIVACSNSTSELFHHRNGNKNLNYITENYPLGSYDLMMTLVSDVACGIWRGSHAQLGRSWGLAHPNTSYTLCDSGQVVGEKVRVRIMQHELSHNFGCNDYDQDISPCTDRCVMSGGYDTVSLDEPDIWCGRCKNDFNVNMH